MDDNDFLIILIVGVEYFYWKLEMTCQGDLESLETMIKRSESRLRSSGLVVDVNDL
jgi:hypothetical protein